MSKLQPVRGTHDILPDSSGKWYQLIETARSVALKFGHRDIAVPIFEFTEVFKRTLGEETDIVSKEMYTFSDRGGDSITLRPEFTAGICRAIISGGLTQSLPMRVFASGPVFRYERPQKGRMRQFHQLDLETFGNRDPLTDAEIISAGYEILKALGVKDKVKLELNSLGSPEDRAKYREVLVSYFSNYEAELSEDSKRRLELNPLRILDSKDEGDKKINSTAPKFSEHMGGESSLYFRRLQDYLGAINIPFELNEKLVRGLDYYNDTVFEFTTNLLGSQNAVLAGGRYDGLIRIMGGHDVPAVGFAAGIERLVELAEIDVQEIKPMFIVPLDPEQVGDALCIAGQLRESGYVVEVQPPGNASKAFKRANQANSPAVLVLGPDEIKNKQVAFKNMQTGQQRSIDFTSVIEELKHEAK